MRPGLRSPFRFAPRRGRVSSRSVLVSHLVPRSIRRLRPPAPHSTRPRASTALVFRRRLRPRRVAVAVRRISLPSFSFHGSPCRRFTVPLAPRRERRLHHHASVVAGLFPSPRFFAARPSVSLSGASHEQQVLSDLSGRFEGAILVEPGTAGRSARAEGPHGLVVGGPVLTTACSRQSARVRREHRTLRHRCAPPAAEAER